MQEIAIVKMNDTLKRLITICGILGVDTTTDECSNTPLSYLKYKIINYLYSVPDEYYERDKHCHVSCCGNWKTGPAPLECKKCSNYIA